MKHVLLLSGCLAVLASPAYAWNHHDGGGSSFLGSFLGGAAGSVVGNALSQPAPPPAPVYVTPVPRTVYIAPTPVYVQPAYTLQAQQRLHDLGLLAGPVDGVYGEGTRRAILNWQTIHNRPASGYLSGDDLALLLPETQPVQVQVQQQPVQQQPPVPAVVAAPPATIVPVAVAPAQVIQQPAPYSPPPTLNPGDPFSVVKEGMPYGLARQKLATTGWQTGFFSSGTNISDSDRYNRSYFVDHRMMEVEDCAASGCAMQFHNNEGRVLYVFTQSGSRDSDAYHGAGPAVIGMCLDHKDMACTTDDGASQSQAAR